MSYEQQYGGWPSQAGQQAYNGAPMPGGYEVPPTGWPSAGQNPNYAQPTAGYNAAPGWPSQTAGYNYYGTAPAMSAEQAPTSWPSQTGQQAPGYNYNGATSWAGVPPAETSQAWGSYAAPAATSWDSLRWQQYDAAATQQTEEKQGGLRAAFSRVREGLASGKRSAAEAYDRLPPGAQQFARTVGESALGGVTEVLQERYVNPKTGKVRMVRAARDVATGRASRVAVEAARAGVEAAYHTGRDQAAQQ